MIRLVRARQPIDGPCLRFDPDGWPGCRARCAAEDGLHFLLAAGRREFRLWLMEGAAPPLGTPLRAVIDLDAYTVEQADAVVGFWRHAGREGAVARPAAAPRQPREVRLARTLQALDGWLAGASYREIAAAVFGERRVREDWGKGSSLRDATILLVKSGRALMEGGYRTLLKPRKRRRPSHPDR